MTIQYAESVLTELVAPTAHLLRSPEIPDLESDFPESAHWVSNWFLNSLMRARFKPPFHQLVAAYLHRTKTAFGSFHRARRKAIAIAQAGVDSKPGAYLAATEDWESCVLNLQMAMEVFAKIDASWNEHRNPGTPDASIWTMANHVKHYGESTLARVSQLAGGGGTVPVLPLWFDDSGLHSVGKNGNATVSYKDLAAFVHSTACVANELQDPCPQRTSADPSATPAASPAASRNDAT